MLTLLICVTWWASTSATKQYSSALEKSLLFYQAQRSGHLGPDSKVSWRSDAHLNDEGQDGEDLSGGYYDAGDYIKFGFPLAFSLTMLSWGGLEFTAGYEDSGLMSELESTVRWGTDYLLKCHTGDYELYGQVGDSKLDHNEWTRPEDSKAKRPAFKISKEQPGSDLAAETSAALASAAFLFEETDPGYSAELLRHAKQLFRFALKYPGKYQDSIKDAKANYPSSSYADELVWAAAWLHLATNQDNYLRAAERMYDAAEISEASELSWDDKGPGVMALLAMATDKQKYKQDLESYCDEVIHKKPRSPLGMVFLSRWGSLRHAANAGFVCLVASHLGVGNSANYTNFSVQQIDYMLGLVEGGHSYVVGYGDNPPQRPHHASSSCPARPQVCDWSAFNNPGPNPHTLHGALVGGPDNADDEWQDDRANYVTNEVSLDYNAAFSGLLAGVIELKSN